jgi:glutamate-ammonia-ligase adenylyltransferase
MQRKRGAGGTVDTEFVVQMLQVRHGADDASIRKPGTLDAIESLKSSGYLHAADADYFSRSYRFQRNVEARIRLMDSSGRHELPENEQELAKLAYLLGQNQQQLIDEAQHYFAENRLRFNRIFDEAERG